MEIYGWPVVYGAYPHGALEPAELAREVAAQVAAIQAKAPRWQPLVHRDPETTWVFALRVIERVDGGEYL